MNALFVLEFADRPKLTIERFPHEDEEGFIRFLVCQHRPTKILRYTNGEVVYERKDGE